MFSSSLNFFSFEPTYKELKRRNKARFSSPVISFEPTYKELKPKIG